MISTLLIISFLPQSSYSINDLDKIQISVKNVQKYELKESDVLIIKTKIFNDGLKEIGGIDLLFGVKLIDSKNRQYSALNYSDLNEKGASLSEEDCPYLVTDAVAPGLSLTRNFCFEIPKDTGLGYGIVLYANFFCTTSVEQCQSRIFPFSENSDSGEHVVKTEKIPSWVKNIFKWYSEGTISEDEVINAIKFLINQGIVKLD